MPGGAICVLHTRWHARDLIGRLIKDAAMNPDADQYEVFEFPAILNEDDPERVKSLWPEQWSLESLLRSKASMPSWQWNAQYQQNPSARESAIIKRDWIQWWPHEDPPPCDFIIQSYDTALTTKERSDYSVCQTWGVWTNEEDNSTNLVLLNSVKGKYEFPELKTMALQQYKDWEPDSVIVETKASGQPLVDEMRRSGLFVQEFSPGKGQDKIARLNAVSDMFSAGHVWFPETQWATEVVEELLAFPNGEHDDQCFVANTKILMADGRESDIFNVTEGDFVWTPTGAQRVLVAGCSSEAATVVEVIFSDGRKLVGTANHPVYIPAAQAFVPLGNLQKGDCVCTSKQLNTEGLLTVDTLVAKAYPCAGISTVDGTGQMRHSTAAYGKTPTDPYPWVCRFTTKMKTLATTLWTTLSVSLPWSTGRDIEHLPRLTQRVSVTGLGLTARGGKKNPLATPVRIVAEGLRRFKQTVQSFALLDATTNTIPKGRPQRPAASAEPTSQLHVERPPAPTPARLSESAYARLSAINYGISLGPSAHTAAFAPNAGLALKVSELQASRVPQSVKNQESCGCSVSAVRALPGRTPVYNLTVEGNPVFYANGVLVHNCDALTLALYRARQGGLLRLRTDQEDNEPFQMARRAAYY
jgi:predicted phage terminase large subunit-like protein